MCSTIEKPLSNEERDKLLGLLLWYADEGLKTAVDDTSCILRHELKQMCRAIHRIIGDVLDIPRLSD